MRPGSRSAEALLPSPGVRFAPDFAARLALFVARRAGPARREGRGRAAQFGAGEELVGHRPYRAGDDPRRIDWGAAARFDRPFVRVTRREASERWAVVVDTSASMGVGVPGKLQRAAEVAAAVCAAGLRAGARVSLCATGGGELAVGRRADLARALAFLEGLRATGAAGLARAGGSRLAGAGRAVLLGDLFDAGPELLGALARPGRDVALGWILAPEELAPAGDVPVDPVEWVDPETGERVRVPLDRGTLAAYERAVGAELERWRELAARHRVAFRAWTTAREPEEVAPALLGAV